MASDSRSSTKDVAGDTKLGGLREALDSLPPAINRLAFSELENAVKKSSEMTQAVVSLINKQGSELRSFRTIQSTVDIGGMVRDARKQMHFSQQRLADLAGVGRRFISELESGKPTLEFNRVAKVCAACGIDLFGKARAERR